MIIDFENPGLVVLQVVPLNLDGTVKAALTSANVRVYHLAAGAEVIDRASVPLVHVPASKVWRYLWEPAMLAVGEYIAEYLMVDTDGFATAVTEDIIIRNNADVSALAIEANVEGHVTDALNTYDPPTRTEATADKEEVIAAMPSVPTVIEIDTRLSGTHGAGSWETGAGKDWTDGEKEQIRDALGVDGVKATATGGQIQSIKDDIKRLLGLDHENIFIDNTAYDADEQLVSARVRLFDSKAHCDAATDGGSETAGLIATYALTTNWEAVNKFRIFKQTRE